MKLLLWVYVSFCDVVCVIFGRTSDASEDVADEAEVVCSARIVVLCAIQAYNRGVGCDDEDAIV